jgi:hypothetical protein
MAILIPIFLTAGLLNPVAAQQRKQKDPVLQQYLLEEFARINAKLDEVSARVTALEAEMGRVKQNQTDLQSEVRGTQVTAKTMDTALSTFRLGTQQDLFSLKTDLTQVRQDLSRIMDLLNRTIGAQPPPQPAAPEATATEGYITAVSENGQDVTINMGSGAGVRVGAEFDVFKANDPKKRIGIVEVTEVLDANNSRAKIVYVQPNFRFEFSDIVRPR